MLLALVVCSASLGSRRRKANLQQMSSIISIQTWLAVSKEFPGASLLGGVRKVFESGFILEAEAGLAFPTVMTGKAGLGIQRFAGGPSTTLGLRPWPLHAYFQQSFPTKRCERALSERAQRRLHRRGKDRNNLRCSDWYFTLEVGTNTSISFDSGSIISVGRRVFFD